jgi:endoglycosylceramidase
MLDIIPVPGGDPIPVFERVYCDDIEGPALFRSVRTDLLRTGGSSLLTEFGGCDGSPVCDDQLDFVLDTADEYLQSWIFWGDVIGRPDAIKHLSRVYARAVAGQLLGMQYIPQERVFYLSYFINPAIKQPTEIYIPSILFPQQSYNITVNSALKWRVDPSNINVILVEPNEQLVKSKDQAVVGSIDIHPKK